MGKDEVVPTACTDWSLNHDQETKKLFWWHRTYSISIWNANLKLESPYSQLDDTAVWRAFIRYQLSSVYRVCSFCKHPEGNDDLAVCCYCGSTVHTECSMEATQEQMNWKPANAEFREHLRACAECEGVAETMPRREHKRERDNARRAVLRSLALSAEYPPVVLGKLKVLSAMVQRPHDKQDDENLMRQLRAIVAEYFQPPSTTSMLEKRRISNKGGGIGVVATKRIPAFTVVGVYPGYEDPLSGEQVKIGRPSPKYSLVDLNCANYYNEVFEELQDTFTPFVNEPNVGEVSNCAWIQEVTLPEGRLSIITVCDVQEGEELLIGYGPLYPRDYPHTYDAYAFHSVEGYDDPPCFALWRWASVEEKDSSFVCYIGYDSTTATYTRWETEDEAKVRRAQQLQQSMDAVRTL